MGVYTWRDDLPSEPVPDLANGLLTLRFLRVMEVPGWELDDSVRDIGVTYLDGDGVTRSAILPRAAVQMICGWPS